MTDSDMMAFLVVVLALCFFSLISIREILHAIAKGYHRLVEGLKFQPYLHDLVIEDDHAKKHHSLGPSDLSHAAQVRDKNIFPRSRRNA